MKLYLLQRDIDNGLSGTGLVAEVIVFSNGKAVVSWNGGVNQLGISSVVIYDTLDDLKTVHCRDKYTRLVFIGQLVRDTLE